MENKGKALCAKKGDRKAWAMLGKQQVDLCSWNTESNKKQCRALPLFAIVY